MKLNVYVVEVLRAYIAIGYRTALLIAHGFNIRVPHNHPDCGFNVRSPSVRYHLETNESSIFFTAVLLTDDTFSAFCGCTRIQPI